MLNIENLAKEVMRYGELDYDKETSTVLGRYRNRIYLYGDGVYSIFQRNGKIIGFRYMRTGGVKC